MADLSQVQGILSGNTPAQPVQMMQATPGSFLQDQFMQTPAYQLAYGNNTSLDPSQRFLNDSGTQLAIQAGMSPLINHYESQGLGGSGAEQQAIAQYMYNNYNSFNTQQSNLLNNYQGQLSGLVTQGAANSGANNAYNAGTTQAGLLSGNNLATGQNISNANLATGSNISSLYGNQGVLNAGAYLNTGAAQSSNLLNGLSLLAQLNQAQAAGNAQTQSSLLNGQGALNGARSLSGASGNTGGQF